MSGVQKPQVNVHNQETGPEASRENVPVLERVLYVLKSGGVSGLYADAALLAELASLAVDASPTYAAVRATLQKQRASIRDLEKVLKPLVQKIWAERSAAAAPSGGTEYSVKDGRLARERQTQDGAVMVPLANFDCRIVYQTVHDDGADQTTYLTLEGALPDGRPLPRVDVRADEFPRMDWPIERWGAEAVVLAGPGTKDHLRAAIQLLSGSPPRRTVFSHVGWREIAGEWYYLHAGGAIGASGNDPAVEVSLPEALSRFRLPDPPDGKHLQRAVRANLCLATRLAPDRIAFPLLVAPARAALGDVDCSIHLCGPTGCFKTELAALAQQHFGAEMDSRHLPASWSSTGNSLEVTAFAAKDALLSVDDFAPSGGTGDVQRLHREADRILRAQGNRSGRSRLRSDGTLRTPRPPRGLIFSTGEDTPRGQSLRSRMFNLEVSPGDINKDRLSFSQRDARIGLYAQAMAGFLHWLAPRYAKIRGRLRGEHAAIRSRVNPAGLHARTPGIVADLALGLEYWLRFAVDVGAIDEGERSDLTLRGWNAFCEEAAEQAAHVAAAEPTNLFLRFLVAVLASGRAHVTGPDGWKPADNPQAWGWVQGETGTDWKPRGRQIGWVDDKGFLFLEPEAVYAEVQQFAGTQGESLPVSARTLTKRLHEKKLLAVTDTAGGKTRYTVRRTLQGERREVLCLFARSLYPSDEGGTVAEPWRTRETGVRQTASECANGALAKPECATASTRENAGKNGHSRELAHSAHSETNIGVYAHEPAHTQEEGLDLDDC